MKIETSRKLFAGPRLKRLRRERQLTQARMAEELDVSPSYLNLMERNQRPLTAQILIRLSDVYDVDPRAFMAEDHAQAVGDVEHVLADALFRDGGVPKGELQDAAEHAPALVAAFQKLYGAYVAVRETREARVFVGEDPDRATSLAYDNPIDRVRGVLHEARNHFPELEAAAEALAADLALAPGDLFGAITERLRERHGLRVRVLPVEVMEDRLRRHDHHRRQLTLSEVLDAPGRTFQAAYQLALSEAGPLIATIAARLDAEDETCRRLLRVTLANYWAAALMMPYARFHEAAELLGYDIELLGARFGASFEQIAHRLTTLSRPTARGIPFFLVRVDIAGNVSKRFSSSRFPFAQTGGTCPLWNLHATFTNPGRILTQAIELPDGSKWFSIARTVRRTATAFGAITPRFAVGLGCDLKYARRLVYARRLDLATPDTMPIGVNCRLCDRPACPQRAAPPALRRLRVEESARSLAPFMFDDD